MTFVLIFFSIVGAFLPADNTSGKDTKLNDHQLPPKAVIHIGPNKTGSTHVQVFLSAYANELQNAGFSFPKHEGTGTFFGPKDAPKYFFGELRATHTANGLLGRYLRSALDKGQNVLISETDFSSLHGEEEIGLLKSMLQGFVITIVIVYREPLSHLQSEHNARYHSFRTLPSNGAFLLDGIRNREMLRWETMISEWSSFFGESNIKIIDYYGVLEAGSDEAYVLVCEIAGVLCDEAARELQVRKVSPGGTSSMQTDPSHDETKIAVLQARVGDGGGETSTLTSDLIGTVSPATFAQSGAGSDSASKVLPCTDDSSDPRCELKWHNTGKDSTSTELMYLLCFAAQVALGCTTPLSTSVGTAAAPTITTSTRRTSNRNSSGSNSSYRASSSSTQVDDTRRRRAARLQIERDIKTISSYLAGLKDDSGSTSDSPTTTSRSASSSKAGSKPLSPPQGPSSFASISSALVELDEAYLVVPLLHVDLHSLHPYAKQIDSELRERFSGNILYGNVAANDRARDQVQVSELAWQDMMQDQVFWLPWMQWEVEKLRDLGHFTNCRSEGWWVFGAQAGAEFRAFLQYEEDKVHAADHRGGDTKLGAGRHRQFQSNKRDGAMS